MANYPMTQIEYLLKHYYQKSGENADYIFSAAELTDYLKQMSRFYKKEKSLLHITDGSGVEPNKDFLKITDSVIHFNREIQDLDALVDIHANHHETHFFMENLDISTSRALRYMPPCWHTDDFFCVYYAFGGSCSVHFQNEIVTIRSGTVLVVAPSVLHACLRNNDDLELITYRIRSSTFDKVFWNQLPPENLMSSFFHQALNGDSSTAYIHFETENGYLTEKVLREIYDETCKQNPYRSQMLNVLMSNFFILLLRHYEGTARFPRKGNLQWNHKYSALLSYIQNNFSTTSLTELSQKFHYSARQISRIVQNCTGMGYTQLILKLRMEKAHSLLQHQSISVEAVANEVGYSASSSFYRAFVKYYGHAPSHMNTV